MTKRMLIDATHAEETRVVVLDGTRLEDFDVETSTKKQLKGNIYLAKVVRVEPSLQAAFVEYGGNRHGFLAFGEIHPDYYQIPVADRQRLLALQAEEARRQDEEEDREAAAEAAAEGHSGHAAAAEEAASERYSAEADEPYGGPDEDTAPAEPGFIETEARFESLGAEPVGEPAPEAAPGQDQDPGAAGDGPAVAAIEAAEPEPSPAAQPLAMEAEIVYEPLIEDAAGPDALEALPQATSVPIEPLEARDEAQEPGRRQEPDEQDASQAPDQPVPETVGGDADPAEESRDKRLPSRYLRNYRIQEVIRRRQILLVQVVKEERGSKGAALTTYLSLAGRYCVLMPNSPRGGGISRKITSAADRRRLKEVTAEMDLPPGMGLIVRTAGANRPKAEIKRDGEYLMRLWDDIREHTLKSVAPSLIYEEASLIKRAIRDVYSRDVDEVVVDGEEGWKAARDFMRMLMPTHAKNVHLWRDGGMPLFARNQVEAQLDAMMMPTVQLRSGGYLVINQTEALVAIDVNSGRSTRERNIEETALRTNLEAADEVARQLRLRDLAGLIVIDFIDMESRKHNGMVEKRLKDALKVDRARIQVGHISHFGLLEMSRQRLRPSLAETSFVMCAQCGGTGHVRSIESSALHVLRHIEEEGAKRRAAEIVVHVASSIAMYILNHKRDLLGGIEQRYAMRVTFQGDNTLIAPQLRIDRVRAQISGEALSSDIAVSTPAVPSPIGPSRESGPDETDDETESEAEAESEDAADTAPAEADAGGTDEQRRRRRRRRRRGGRREEGGVADPLPGLASAPPTSGEPGEDSTAAPENEMTAEVEPHAASTAAAASDEAAVPQSVADEPGPPPEGEDGGRGRRRGRRGGRRRRRDEDEALSPVAELDAEQPELPQTPYSGPTPANPFGTGAFDIFEVMERVEETRAGPPASTEEVRAAPAPEAARTPEPPPVASAPETERAQQVAAATEVTDAETAVATEPDPALDTPIEQPAPESPPLAEAHAVESAPEPAMAEPELELAAAPPATSEPVVRPILVGTTDAPPAEKKRGWWRR